MATEIRLSKVKVMKVCRYSAAFEHKLETKHSLSESQNMPGK